MVAAQGVLLLLCSFLLLQVLNMSV